MHVCYVCVCECVCDVSIMGRPRSSFVLSTGHPPAGCTVTFVSSGGPQYSFVWKILRSLIILSEI